MKSFLILFVIGLSTVAGCASINEPPPSTDRVNPRIVYRNLTVPITEPAPEAPLVPVQPDPDPVAEAPATRRPCHFVAFGNDSSKNFDERSLQAFIRQTSADAVVLVLGHSHGQSTVATHALAARRAETIVARLTGNGYENVHAMAFWGERTVPFCPDRGVQLYVLDAGSEQVAIAFSKDTKKEPPHVSPEGIDVLDGHRTDQGGLDNV